MAILNLTDVKQQINDVKRNLFFEDGLTVKFVNISKVLLELENGWYLDKNPQRELGSPEFYQLSITSTDELDLGRIIPLSTSIKIGDVEYTASEYTRPRELTNEWIVKLQTAQMSKRDI